MVATRRRGGAWGEWRTWLGVLLGLVARVWLSTLRLRVVTHDGLRGLEGRPWVFAFFHGTQWPLLAWPHRRATSVLVSWSPDGTLQAGALGVLGFRVVRGSTSRGGARALAALVRVARTSRGDAAFAVDGPRGPYGVAKGGARVAARALGGVLVPMGVAVKRGHVLERAWDRFGIAWPFSEVVISLGPPLAPDAPSGATDPVLAGAIAEANLRARAALGASVEYSGVPAAAGVEAAGAHPVTK